MSSQISFIFGTITRHHRWLMHVKIQFGSVPHLSNYDQFYHDFGVYALFSEMSEWMSFIFGIMIKYYGCLMHVKYNLALCQNVIIITNFIMIVVWLLFLDACTDFIHIWYHDQVPWVPDACLKVQFGFVPK